MRRRRLAASLLLVAASAAALTAGRSPDAAVLTFLGEPATRILKGGTRVEAFRINNSGPIDPAATGPMIDRYPITVTGPEQDARFAARLAAVFLDGKTYDFNMAKGCMFNPGVAFRVWAGRECVELILCFECTEFKLIVKDAQGKPVRKVGEDFDGARPALVKLAQDAFPGDAAIMALK